MPSAEQLDRELVRGFCRRCGFPFRDQARQGVCRVPPACERRLHDPTYQVPSERLAAVEVRVRRHLIQRVKDAGVDHPLQATITYTDLCNAIDPEQRYWSPPRFQGVGKVLDRISTCEHQGGRPLLSAMVVQAGAHHAGDGFIKLSRRLGHEIQSGQELAFWRAQVREVAQYWATSGQGGSASSDVHQAKASLGATSPVQQAEEAVTKAAGKAAGPGRGQGFQLDQEVKAAVEAHAMNMATEFYAAAWEVEDVHGKESYDLVCRRGDEVKHVEVKGTTTAGTEVILTPNEVRHAREHGHNALFILSNIRVERAADGTVKATGGVQYRYDPWRLDDGTLVPIGFRYQIPQAEPQ